MRLARQRREDGSAPVTVIIGMDLAFYDKLPSLFPHAARARGSRATRRSPTRPRSAIEASRAATSSSRRARSAWIAAR